MIGSDESIYDQAEQDIEDMTEEVERIIKSVYDPSAGTGVFWSTNRRWLIEDKLDVSGEMRLELVRTLNLQLTRIKSRSITLGDLGRLKTQEQQGVPAVQSGGGTGLFRVQDAAVGGPQFGLDDRPGTLGPGREGGEGHARGGSEARPRLNAHPGFGNDAENAFATQG